MVHARPALPAGHGEVLRAPPFAEWAALAAQTAAVPRVALRRRRRVCARECVRWPAETQIAAACASRATLGVPVRQPGDPDAPIVMTGHQPELYHPGVWVKDFLVDRLAEETGCARSRPGRRHRRVRAGGAHCAVPVPGGARVREYLARAPGPAYAGSRARADERPATSARPGTRCSRRCRRRRCGGTSSASASASRRRSRRDGPRQAHDRRASPLRGVAQERLSRVAARELVRTESFAPSSSISHCHADRFAAYKR